MMKVKKPKQVQLTIDDNTFIGKCTSVQSVTDNRINITMSVDRIVSVPGKLKKSVKQEVVNARAVQSKR